MNKNLIFLMAAVSAMASCQKQQDINSYVPQQDEIVFTAGGDLQASVETKSVTAVTSLSGFNVLCVTGTMGSKETTVFNAAFSGTTAYKGGQFWPATNQSYKFYGANEAMTASASGPTISAANTKDIVCAVLGSPTYKSTNTLSFKHIFARIGSCNITAPTNYTVSNLAVKITPKKSGTYSLFTGDGKTDGTGWSSTSDGSETTIASAVSSTTDNNLYLVPGSYTLTATYTLSQGAYSESFTKTASVSLVGGKINNISATLPSGGASEITFTINIASWDDNTITADLS